VNKCLDSHPCQCEWSLKAMGHSQADRQALHGLHLYHCEPAAMCDPSQSPLGGCRFHQAASLPAVLLMFWCCLHRSPAVRQSQPIKTKPKTFLLVWGCSALWLFRTGYKHTYLFTTQLASQQYTTSGNAPAIYASHHLTCLWTHKLWHWQTNTEKFHQQISFALDGWSVKAEG